jgi:hypothetical protein
VRYRLPMDALLMPFAALAVVGAWDLVKSRLPIGSLANGGRSDLLRAHPPR